LKSFLVSLLSLARSILLACVAAPVRWRNVKRQGGVALGAGVGPDPQGLTPLG